MPDYRLLSSAAGLLGTQEAVLCEFRDKGWLSVIERKGTTFLGAREQYKAKYILHLRDERGLTDDQITTVLANQTPPYSSKDVDKILQSAQA